VLAGEAGVGKTRLAREMLAAAAHRGAATRWVVGTASGASLPFGAFGSAVGDVGGDQTRQLARATATLLSGARPAGLVLGVDDGHLLDEQSALIVHHLVTRSSATVIVTKRTGEPAPDAVTALWKDGYLPRLEIQPLSGEETAELLEVALGGPVHSATVRRIWSITQGNPLYLRNLVDGEVEAGRLTAVAGVWQWTGAVSLSPGLTELIKDRIGTLSGAERDVADLLAFGEPVGVELLTRHADRDAAERLESRGLIQIAADGRRRQARLAHPLYGEVLRATCGQLRARRVRGRLATMLAATGCRRADDLLRRATLARDSDLLPDPELLTAAAQRAAELVDHRLAETLARAAIRAGGGFTPRLILANALTGRGDGAEREIADLERSATTDAERLQAALLRVLDLAWMQGLPAAAEAALQAAEQAGIADPGGELRAVRAQFDSGMGRVERAGSVAGSVLADPASSDMAVACASWAATAALGMAGRTGSLTEIARRGQSIAETLPGGAWWGVSIAGRLADGLLLAGDLVGARTIAAECADRFPEEDVPGSIGRILSGQVEYAVGRIARAVRLLTEGRAGLTPNGVTGGWLDMCHLLRVLAVAVSAEHWHTARQAMTDADAVRHPLTRTMTPITDLARAWVAAAEGAVSEAARLAGKAADDAASRGQHAHAVVALHDAVRFGDRTVATRLADLASRVDGPRGPAAAAHAAALAEHDADGLLAASETLQRMGALLHAADAAAQASAEHSAQGRRGSAATAAERSRQLLARCPDARTPASTALQQPVPLTTREREIAALAATGLTNQDIAARLQVSVRTVEGHLYNAYRKLGTTSRAGLVALLLDDRSTRT
jgi:DNA-binding CsgD family transcriptional regulator